MLSARLFTVGEELEHVPNGILRASSMSAISKENSRVGSNETCATSWSADINVNLRPTSAAGRRPRLRTF
ncbi:hypothetical protein COLAER_01428 [Collinsella aerofaciens ATCC 25986]|uniref:Uncharacterized protein n=1 Tax=Collinsella aerofaciens (strain ATCC 25986 / DSM 3979 / JCM 10188 / KCTC 3647 / NCTC 11838 / VPI 1003) TaxID=411903 RepID=A4EAH1_COLAA|nr:hypothetical protein COLAER_01428 [Collinsella aerofaciens ATCC 25986]